MSCIRALTARIFSLQTRFNASVDNSRSLHAMASSGMGVWISIQSLSVIRLYHASTCEHLADVDTKDAVHKMLAGNYNTEIIFVFSEQCCATNVTLGKQNRFLNCWETFLLP